jgi:hypothetical protein
VRDPALRGARHILLDARAGWLRRVHVLPGALRCAAPSLAWTTLTGSAIPFRTVQPYTGSNCSIACGGNGVAVGTACKCFTGYGGADCSLTCPDCGPHGTCTPVIISGGGLFADETVGVCGPCDAGWCVHQCWLHTANSTHAHCSYRLREQGGRQLYAALLVLRRPRTPRRRRHLHRVSRPGDGA